MGKFAGFLKRAKNFAKNAIHTIAKGATAFKKGVRKYYIEPMTEVLTTVLPQIKPLTDVIFKVDDKIIKGMEWLTNKTSYQNNNNQIKPSFYQNNPDNVPGHRPIPITPNNPSQPIRTPLDRTYFNFNK